MIRGKHFLVAGTLLLGACQMFSGTPLFIGDTQAPARSPMDGTWASTDGIFYANFQGGSFTSRFTQTNEVLAQGSYSVTGQNIAMQWMSVATQQQRSANCRFANSNRVQCQQTGGGSFTLTRSA
jgi:hypothetical protein